MTTTPRPWIVVENIHHTVIFANDGREVISQPKKYGSLHVSKEDAALIVRAVNSYDAMREALEWYRDEGKTVDAGRRAVAALRLGEDT